MNDDPALTLATVTERVVATGSVVSLRSGHKHDIFPVAIPAVEGAALRDLVATEGARQTIEVGLGYGISGLFIVAGLLAGGDREVRHTVIDPHQSTRFDDVGIQLLEEAGVIEIVELHAAPSELVLPQLLERGRRFDLAFVDGNHRFDGVFVDLTYLGRLVRPGGAIFLDDYQLPAVARAAAFFLRNMRWSLEAVGQANAEHSWAVLRTADPPLERNFDHFVEF